MHDAIIVLQDVYCGRESVCTVEGLHYAALYSARVCAYNAAGAGPYSDVIGLQTSPGQKHANIPSITIHTHRERTINSGIAAS